MNKLIGIIEGKVDKYTLSDREQRKLRENLFDLRVHILNTFMPIVLSVELKAYIIALIKRINEAELEILDHIYG